MPRQPECNCDPCVRRRAMNMRWHNKPGVKERRLAANASRARENRKQNNWLPPSRHPDPRRGRPEPTDAELDARALADLESRMDAI
jgi:hypothetical protein